MAKLEMGIRMTIRYDGQVAIVTGAATGLGRAHAMALAARGAKVLVNDLYGAEAVVAEIEVQGGTAMFDRANLSQPDELQVMIEKVMGRWGRIDILVNNAALSRHQSFSNTSLEDFGEVVNVNLMGTVACCKAVWEVMKRQNYGRIVMTSSPAAMYGNYGGSHQGAVNMGLMGLMNTLHLEGIRYGIRINTLSPVMCSQLWGGLIDESYKQSESMASITAALLYLVSDQAPAKYTLSAGEGVYSASLCYETAGTYLPPSQQTPECIAEKIDEINDPVNQVRLHQGAEQSMRFISLARKARRSLFSRMPGSFMQGGMVDLKKSADRKPEVLSKATSRPFFSRLWRPNNG